MNTHARYLALAILLAILPMSAWPSTSTETGEGETSAGLADVASPEPLPEPVAPPANEVDMTAFQEAYDREVAASQAEATGAPNPNPLPEDDAPGMAELALRSVAALAGICGAILLLGWAARRFGRGTPLLAGASLAQVLGRTYLEPKVSLHFVKTGGRVLVIGVTAQSIALITEFDALEFEGAVDLVELPKPGVESSDFLSRLKEQQVAAASSVVKDEDLDALRGDIQRLKQFLQESRRGGL